MCPQAAAVQGLSCRWKRDDKDCNAGGRKPASSRLSPKEAMDRQECNCGPPTHLDAHPQPFPALAQGIPAAVAQPRREQLLLLPGACRGPCRRRTLLARRHGQGGPLRLTALLGLRRGKPSRHSRGGAGAGAGAFRALLAACWACCCHSAHDRMGRASGPSHWPWPGLFWRRCFITKSLNGW